MNKKTAKESRRAEILIHGLGQTAGAWNEVIKLLPETAAPICPELSSFIGNGSYGELYRGSCAYLDGLDQPLELCGLSLGAVLALNYTIDHPEHVHRLALIAPQFRMPKALLRFQGLLFRLAPQRAFEGCGLTKQQMISLTLDTARLDFTGALGGIRCPVFIACGERDRANIKAARELAGLLDRSVTLIGGAGHEVNTSSPENSARFITEAFITEAFR